MAVALGTTESTRVVPRKPERSHGRRAFVGLLVLLALGFGPLVASRTAQPASRYALTAAIADHGTVDITRYSDVLGIDRADYGGRLRSDKGPLQPVLAVPAYLVSRAVGAAPAERQPLEGDLQLWWLTLWTAFVPFLVLLALVGRAVARIDERLAVPVAVSIGVGTILFPHAVNLYAHTLSACLGFAAWELARHRRGEWALLWAGFAAGAAVATEYHLMIVAVVVAGVAVQRDRLRGVVRFAAGAAGPLVFLAWYQWRAFGAPWRTPFAYYAGELGGTTSGGWHVPSLGEWRAVFLDDRGLLFANPVVLVGIAAAVALVLTRRRGDTGASGIAACDSVAAATHTTEALGALVVVAGYLTLVAGWTGTRWLEEPGPRYLAPALPFLAVPLAWWWPRVRRIAATTAAWGGVMMVSAATTFILVSTHDTAMSVLLYRLRHAQFLPTVWTETLGSGGVWVHAASVVVAVVVLIVRALRSGEHSFAADTLRAA